MKFEIMFKAARYVYKKYLRGLVIEKVKDSKTKWDDYALAIVDKIFGVTK